MSIITEIERFGRNTYNKGHGVLKSIYKAAWLKVAPIMALGVFAQWSILYSGYESAIIGSVFIGFVGYLAIWFFILKPKHIEFFAFFGAIFGWRSPLQGAVRGANELLDITVSLSRDYLFLSFVLWTWPFAAWTFWPIFAVVIILSSFGPAAGIKAILEVVYCLVMAVVLLIGSAEPAFDPCTGESLILVDPITGNEHSRLEASECAVWLYSPESGEKLRAQTSKEALDRNPKAGGGGFWDKAGSLYNPLNQSEEKPTEVTPTSVGATLAPAKFGSDCGKPAFVPYIGQTFSVEAGQTIVPSVKGPLGNHYQLVVIDGRNLSDVGNFEGRYDGLCRGDPFRVTQAADIIVVELPPGKNLSDDPEAAHQLARDARETVNAKHALEQGLAEDDKLHNQ